MKMRLVSLLAVLVLLAMSGSALAALQVIGTATYLGTDYNLIWDDDNNGQSVIWLDYTNASINWANQNAWATGLDGLLTITWNPGISVTWTDPTWRLPSAGASPIVGYNQITSEMGHLYYVELGLVSQEFSYPPGYSDSDVNVEGFNNLIASWFWSGTEVATLPSDAWTFAFHHGRQDDGNKVSDTGLGLALRGGQVTSAPTAAIPTLSEWGMIIMSLLLAVSAFWMLRKRQNT